MGVSYCSASPRRRPKYEDAITRSPLLGFCLLLRPRQNPPAAKSRFLSKLLLRGATGVSPGPPEKTTHATRARGELPNSASEGVEGRREARGKEERSARPESMQKQPRFGSPELGETTNRPQIRREYPLNLSILLSGGRETNKDSPSSGERRGKSSE